MENHKLPLNRTWRPLQLQYSSPRHAPAYLDQVGHAEVMLSDPLGREGQADLLGAERRQREMLGGRRERLAAWRSFKLDEGRHV